MKRWRELGEVPDSDDESFDDTDFRDHDNLEELPQDDLDEPPREEPQTAPARDADIWSIPSSSPELVSPPRPHILGQASQILSQFPWPAQSSPEEDEGAAVPAHLERVADRSAPSLRSPTGSPKHSFAEDEISTGYVRATTPGSRASSPASLLSKTPTPPQSPPLTRTHPSHPAARHSPAQNLETLPDTEEEDDELSRQTAVRLQRSLRPRKPIQQHPYLFENARYTTIMKSHGVKPIRVIPQSQPGQRGQEEEDSQDQEFQTEESQEASGGGHGSLEESGPILFDDDEDELALTPSLPKTSPHGQQLRNSSQQTNDHTDATSLSDEEFPPLDRLQPVSAKQRRQLLKRQRSPLPSSTQRKRARFVIDSSSQASPERPRLIPPAPVSIWDLSSSPPVPAPSDEPVRSPATTPGPPRWRRPDTPEASTQRPASTAALPATRRAESPIVINEDTESDPGDDGSSSSAESSGTDSEVVRQNSRRIRGVLPASWLRLDQRQDKPDARNPKRRSPEPSPDRNVRRGVALPRQGSPKPSSTAPLALFDESEDSENEPPQRHNLSDEPVEMAPAIIVIEEDDGASVVEEDAIDWMLPGRKRTGSHKTPVRAKKQKHGPPSVFKGRPDLPSRQPRIDQVLGRSKQGGASSSSKGRSRNQGHGREGNSLANRKSRKRASTPPLLSILDVMEPDAPQFVKIAARAVKRNPNLGKTSPSKKLITLATRTDNVDALSVLRDWKSGKTKPKVTVPQLRQPEKPRGRPALREVSTNSASRRHGTQRQKLVRQSDLNSFVSSNDGQDNQISQPPSTSVVRPRQSSPDNGLDLHPAQLEEDAENDKRRQLSSRKRTLDAFYRRSRRARNTPTDDGLDQVLDVDFTLREPVIQELDTLPDADIDFEDAQTSTRARKRDALTKLRKRRRPQQLDLEAPQYARANDPLPAAFSMAEIQEERRADADQASDKLSGLSPYGTHYTHHFEVFPLDRGVFFHESTVIGRGSVQDAVDAGLPDRIRHQKAALSFPLDGRTLRWAGWHDNTSSELGILVDWVTEQLTSNTTADEATRRKVIEASDFVLGYVLRSLSVQSDVEEKALFSRCLEVFSSFTSRFESIDWSTVLEDAKRSQLEVAVRFSLAIQAVRSLSQSSSGDPMQSMKLEDLLKKFASITIRRLVECGTEELRTLYGDLQRLTFRERGIRTDHVLANCWAVMMRLLENAAIPRGSFWDITLSVMLSRLAASGADVLEHERLWQDMFTLLPLSEVDNSGLLVLGMRHTAPVEGWTLPQQLLKRVFQLYQANPRQPPGFNDYCRALVARCHFLVQQWGWRKCTGIIGTIFDFFGSQNLAHLRNEEVYKSPKFLEELDSKPSLSIDREDRCFHIFIKLLALAIRRLKELGRVNDIRNLVARTLPNHNRQYLKEDTIHQHDLAALRNHHDLLCTLFWVSPPDVRPAVHLIEKLVMPGSAHKEACLINVRAWNQLARFVISSGQGGAAFRPLAAWRNNVFNQVLDQYLSAASDIEQQFRALANKMVGISQKMLDDMVAKNKATALDVLHFLMKASLDVLQRAPSLEAALYALNTSQLQKVFTSLDYQSPGFDWSILRVALDTVEHLMGRIDQASEEQYSSEFADNVDAPHLEDAVLLVNEHLVKDFFWMARTTLALPLEKSSRQHGLQAACVEKTVTLAGRIAARFIKNGVTQLSPYFSTGKHALFSDLPKNLSPAERKYLPLFLAVLVKNHVFNFKEIGLNILGLWMLSIVKPLRFMGYENYLAEVLQHRNLPFLERASVAVGIPPDYNSNLDFFACAIHHMRRILRESGSAQSRKHRDEFSKTLQLVMQKMKEDLALLRLFASEHGQYIDFVRQVISLIKSHGVGICAVDEFFLQPSVDYSPPVQDPQLHAAGIVAYGVRLGEKDNTAAPPLFHYLYNSFKIALGNDKLEQECRILGMAMRNPHVTSFMLQFMIPAAIQASAQVPECWALLEVYTVALGHVLDGAGVPKELADDDMEHAGFVLRAILAWFASLKPRATLPLQQLHIVTLLVTLANMLQPSLATYLANEPDHDESTVPGMQDTLDQLATFFSELQSYLIQQYTRSLSADRPDQYLVDGSVLRNELVTAGYNTADSDAAVRNPRVQYFTSTIVSDVRQNWVVTADRVMVRMASGKGAPVMSQAAATPSSVGSLRGARYGPWDRKGVFERLLGELGRGELGKTELARGNHTGRGGDRGNRGGIGAEELLF